MKTIVLILTVVLATFIFTSCSDNSNSEIIANVMQDTTNEISLADTASVLFQKEQNAMKENQAVSQSKEIPVGEDDFNKLVSFIEKKGFAVPQDGIPCDHQFTFFDSKGNRHAMITSKRDDEGNPSMKGTVNQINVWAYKKGIKDQEHFFGYCISPDRMHPYCLKLDGTWKGADEAAFGFKEFLKKVSE